MPHRVVAHVSIDSFYVSVERKRRPGLNGKPLVVGADGDPSKRGTAMAVSAEAYACGALAGMPLKKAHKLCPEAVFLPVDFEAYEKESEVFMKILGDYSPLVESFGAGEAFLEISPAREDPFPEALEIAQEIKARAKKELGLAVSIGIAPNKLLAMIAGGFSEPGGVCAMTGKDVEKAFVEMPPGRLPGVGPETEKRLDELGIKTVGELSRVPLQHLERNFGPKGRTLFEHARGVDSSPVVPFSEPGALVRELAFGEDVSDHYVIKETLYALAEDLSSKLRSAGFKARSVAVKISYSSLRTEVFLRSFEDFTGSLNDIWNGALNLLESAGVKGPVRLVGLKVSGLEPRKAG